MDDELEDNLPKRSAKRGRRAKKSASRHDELGGDGETLADDTMTVGESQPQEPMEGPPIPSKRIGGWGEDSPTKSGRRRSNLDVEDERLKPRDISNDDDDGGGKDDMDIPVIPDLEEYQEEDMTSQMALAPNVVVNRVATYRELDHDLSKHAPFATLDNEIDLKLLMKCLSAETEVQEIDEPWDWDRLFTEVTSDLQRRPDTAGDSEDKVAA